MTRHAAEVTVTRVFSMMTKIRLSGRTPSTVNITSESPSTRVSQAVHASSTNPPVSANGVCFLTGKNNASTLIIILLLS